MVITFDPELAAALTESPKKIGVSPGELALSALRARFLAPADFFKPRDDWERTLLSAMSDCGVSLSNEAVSSEGLYD